MWKTICSETLIDNYYLKAYRSLVELPDGARINDFYTVSIPDASMIAAITSDGKIVLKNEYRYAIGENVIECPAGMFEINEFNPLDVAKRELLEETGYTSDNWVYLGPSFESTSKLNNRMHLFLAKDCRKTSDQKLDVNEHLDVELIPLSEAVQMVMKGQICANSTAHIILKAYLLLGGNYGL